MKNNPLKIYRFLLLAGIALLGTTACVNTISSNQAAGVTEAPLASQALQTQTFDASKRRVFDAIILTMNNSLQYHIETIDYPSGLIIASSFRTKAQAYGNITTPPVTFSVLVSSVNDEQTVVRVNANQYENQIFDSAFYQTFFADVSHNLFTDDILT